MGSKTKWDVSLTITTPTPCGLNSRVCETHAVIEPLGHDGIDEWEEEEPTEPTKPTHPSFFLVLESQF